MSPTPPWMGSPKNEGEWIVLRGGFHSPAHFFGEEKRIMNWQRAVKPFCDAGLAVF